MLSEILQRGMKTGFILFYWICPVLLKGCCIRKHQKKMKGVQQNTTNQHFRAVEGELFMMPCIKSLEQPERTVWSRSGEDKKGNKDLTFDCGVKFVARVNHSGKYTSLSAGSRSIIILQVVESITVRCYQPSEAKVTLRVRRGGVIYCPGHHCSNNTGTIWFKGNKAVSEQRRSSCNEEGLLRLCEVYEEDTGLYFCDHQLMEEGIQWTYRRAVDATVISNLEPSRCPRIRYPAANMTEEVELGHPHSLTCEVFFDFEVDFLPKVQWFMNYGHNMENMTPLHMEAPQQKQETLEVFEVIQTAVISEVMPQHLKHTFTCFATNSVGNSSVTIKLKQKIKVNWPPLVGYPFAAFLLVVWLGILLRVKWLEIQLMYRSHFQRRRHDGEKEYDVFLSFVWSPLSAEGTQGLTLPSRSGCDCNEEEHLSNKKLMSCKESKSTLKPLEVLLPHVLEVHWGYRLCLPERDLLPGGAYTNDVVLGIKRSRMLVCVLSADYLADSSAVFVLESGIQALLQKSSLKLLLIRTSEASAFLTPSHLPRLVQTALKVLPRLNYSSKTSLRAVDNFWRSLRKAMPQSRKRQVATMECGL
uniref:Interleukin 18 receptor accessory protein n=1 Tax=Oryzias latipes TaxID=8090 RepID=A0A3P9JM02_ORYLA